jgi:hypothetical protein
MATPAPSGTDVIALMGHYTSVLMTLVFYDAVAGTPDMAR